MARQATAISVALALTLVGACTAQGESTEAARNGDGIIVTVMCAPAGASEYSAECSIEREGNQLTIRHANGTFRRFVLDDEGRIAPADGADALDVTDGPEGFVDLRIAGDRYRLDRAALQREQESGTDGGD